MILNENNITYERQFKFDDLVNNNGNKLKFDFAILDNDGKLKYLIEYDGAQHFI